MAVKWISHHRERRRLDAGVCFEPLEPRLLLSASWGAAVVNPGQSSPANHSVSFAQETTLDVAGLGRSDPAGPSGNTVRESMRVDLLGSADALKSSGLDAAAHRELVLVNGDVADQEQLVTDLQGDDTDRRLEVVILDADRNGIEQVTDLLAHRSDLAAVHVITHGSDGQINLGNSLLNSAALQQNADAVASWGSALNDTGDLLFYGCNIAGGTDGQNLLNAIGGLTGADVAASDDNTGHTSLCGDWELEYARGRIETGTAFSAELQQNWGHLLNVAVDATSTGTSTGGDFSVLHTTSGTDRLMLVGVSMNLGGRTSI
jgi:hypothetical protein